MFFDVEVKPDYEEFLKTLAREGTPERVHFMELFLDKEVQDVIVERFDLAKELDPSDPWYYHKLQINLQRFLGYDYVNCVLGNIKFPRDIINAEDTAPSEQTRDTRSWTDEHVGAIQTWEDFENYPWPDPGKADTSEIEWFSRNLPDDMCLIAGAHNFFEQVTWIMSYEGLCFAIYDNPDLVDAMFKKVGITHYELIKVLLQFDRIKLLFGGDDMGFKTATMIDPEILIEKSISWHAKVSELAHENGRMNILHSCGNLKAVMPALLEAGIDGRHSFEDAIEPVTEAKRLYGDKIAVIGGIDVDFLCRADEEAIRKRVRETLDICQPGGGYCLGSGNSVTNYIPVDNYLIMLDEGRKYGR